jgi:integrase
VSRLSTTKELPRGIYEKEPGSKIYWVRYADFEGRLRREKAGNISNAKKLLTVRRNEKLEGKVPHPRVKADPATPILTVGDLIDTATKNTANNRSAQDLHWKFERIRADFGDKEAVRVVKSDIVQWLNERTRKGEDDEGWSPASRNRYQAAFSLIFRYAVDDKKLASNPATGIEHLQEDNSRTRHLSLEEEKALMAELNKQFPTHAPIVTLAMHPGPRASELLRAVVGDYDPETSMLTVHQTKNRRKPPVRYAPMTPMAVEAYNQLAAGKAPGTPLCTQQDGKSPITATEYWFNPCRDDAKLEDFHFHDLRHTAASRWVMNGVPLAVVAGYLGHSNIQMTMRYSHLMPDNNERAIIAMMQVYAKKLTPKTDTKN